MCHEYITASDEFVFGDCGAALSSVITNYQEKLLPAHNHICFWQELMHQDFKFQASVQILIAIDQVYIIVPQETAHSQNWACSFLESSAYNCLAFWWKYFSDGRI